MYVVNNSYVHKIFHKKCRRFSKYMYMFSTYQPKQSFIRFSFLSICSINFKVQSCSCLLMILKQHSLFPCYVSFSKRTTVSNLHASFSLKWHICTWLYRFLSEMCSDVKCLTNTCIYIWFMIAMKIGRIGDTLKTIMHKLNTYLEIVFLLHLITNHNFPSRNPDFTKQSTLI